MAIRAVKNKFQVDVAVTHGGKLIRHRETVPTHKEALIREADVKLALLKGEAVKPIHVAKEATPSEYTLRRCIEGTYQTHWKHAISGRCLYLNANKMTEFAGEDFDIRSWDFEQTEKYKEWLMSPKDQGGLALRPNSCNRKLASLSKVLAWAQDMRLIKDKPRIAYMKKTPGRSRWLSDFEETRILEFFTAATLQDELDVTIVLLDTGARPSELFVRPRTEFDEVQKAFKFWDTKTNKPRTVPLTDRAFASAQRVWPRIRNKQMTYRRYLTSWNGMKSAFGLNTDKEFTPYCLRHTCCTRLIGRGADLMTVLKWMGHDNLATTQGYAHLIASNLDVAKNLLQRA